jgi:D-glycero-D-manno-heptose 1,7-bisphosphate phosphatase
MCWRDPASPPVRSALLLDRDGVINQRIPGGYVLDYKRDFRFIGSFFGVARRFSNVGIPLIVLTNQSCVQRGLVSGAGIAAIMQRMIAELRAVGIRVHGYAVCPHRPDEGCACRKPSPGLFHAVSSLFDLDLWNCAFIGDAATDMAAAKAAGCPAMLVDPEDREQYTRAFKDAFSYISAGFAA